MSGRLNHPGGQMRIEVLGCYGGESRGHLPPTLLIDDTVLLDAGCLGTALTINRQLAVDHVLLSHAHSDHVKGLPCFADLVIGHRRRPVQVHSTAGVLEVIRRHLFNNQLWPDFFALPSTEQPTLQAAPLRLGRWQRVGHLRVKAIAVTHPVESLGFLVRGPGGSFVYSGDTGPTEQLWRECRRLDDLRLLLVETKFPNSLQMVADAAGHLTPRTLAGELAKLGNIDVPILLYHLKPDCLSELRRQIRSLGDRRLSLLRQRQQLQL